MAVKYIQEKKFHPVLWPFQMEGMRPIPVASKNDHGIELAGQCTECFKVYKKASTAKKHLWKTHGYYTV